MLKRFSDISVEQDIITVIGSGNSVKDLGEHDLDYLRSKSLVITMNYAPVRIRGLINMWSDRKVSRWLADHYSENAKETLFLVREKALPRNMKIRIPLEVDYWFSEKKEGLQGNYTIVWLLQLLERYHTDKKILILGLDMAATSRKMAKWYDEHTDFDRLSRGQMHVERKLDMCSRQLDKYLNQPEIFVNSNPNSQYERFEKVSWQEWLEKETAEKSST